VHTHEDLAAVVSAAGLRTVAHPWSAGISPDAAVMVSGNAMAHLYIDLERRARPWWPALAPRHERLAAALLARDAVDLLLLPLDERRCEVRSAARGAATIERAGDVYRYTCNTGDPLGVGGDVTGSADETYDATCEGCYPDAIVQIATLAGSSRAGDLILSAAPGWDFRARYEPIPHRSAHGALHRDHMMVPLLMNRRPARPPRRTTDLFASTLAALGVEAPARMDGASFV
ncbi:MAG TPA: hypothetical protein VFS59_10405, partial [Gemmatimonadaceae bacterium]|nr:hypothetical protein [Gemmatimonadaceae bacterium]